MSLSTQDISFESSDAQIILLALAKLMKQRPGWELVIREISRKFVFGEQVLDAFLLVVEE